MEKLENLVVDWSKDPSREEKAYKNRGFRKTVGTVFLQPPDEAVLLDGFNKLHKNTHLSVGARALCKHVVRISPTAKHPFWTPMTGSEKAKSEVAFQQIVKLLQDACWKNVYLHSKFPEPLYEIRNSLGYGARWKISGQFVGFLEPFPLSVVFLPPGCFYAYDFLASLENITFPTDA